MTDAKLSVPFAIELTPHEVIVAQDAVAAELARYLMQSERWEDKPEYVESYEALVCLGQKLGMEL